MSEHEKKEFSIDDIELNQKIQNLLLNDETLRKVGLIHLTKDVDDVLIKINELKSAVNKDLTGITTQLEPNIQNKIKEILAPLDEKLTALSKSVDIIKEAPDLLASEVGNLNDEVNKVYDNLDSKIKIANNNVEQINASALNTISRAMLESSTEFQRILNASKKEVLSHLKEGTENALKEIGKNSSAELKRLDERVESGLDTTSSIAKSTKVVLGICGLTVIINLITLAILVWVTLI